MRKKPLKIIAGLPDKPLTIGTIKIACYVLEDETRVLTQRGMVAGLGFRSGGGSSGGATRTPRFLTSNTLKPFISKNLTVILNDPILFTLPQGGNPAFGYPATLLADICEIVLAARDAGALAKRHEHITKRCEILMRGFARVGINALVDEATGYQTSRKNDALRIMMEKYIIEEARKWTKEFYDPFFAGLDKIYGNEKTTSQNRPKYYALFINKHVYKPIENGSIFHELDRLNPINKKGIRKMRLHQFLSEDYGLRVLRDRIAKITAIMEISATKAQFDRNYNKLESNQRWFDFHE